MQGFANQSPAWLVCVCACVLHAVPTTASEADCRSNQRQQAPDNKKCSDIDASSCGATYTIEKVQGFECEMGSTNCLSRKLCKAPPLELFVVGRYDVSKCSGPSYADCVSLSTRPHIARDIAVDKNGDFILALYQPDALVKCPSSIPWEANTKVDDHCNTYTALNFQTPPAFAMVNRSDVLTNDKERLMKCSGLRECTEVNRCDLTGVPAHLINHGIQLAGLDGQGDPLIGCYPNGLYRCTTGQECQLVIRLNPALASVGGGVPGETHAVYSVALHPDGDWIITEWTATGRATGSFLRKCKPPLPTEKIDLTKCTEIAMHEKNDHKMTFKHAHASVRGDIIATVSGDRKTIDGQIYRCSVEGGCQVMKKAEELPMHSGEKMYAPMKAYLL